MGRPPLAAILVLASAWVQGGCAEPPRAEPAALADLDGGEPLDALFAAGAGRPRLLLLLSPT